MSDVQSERLLTPFRSWLNDPSVREIMMNRPGEVYVEKGGVVTRHSLMCCSRLHLDRMLQLIARENGKVFDGDQPLLSGTLYDQSRIQAIYPPIADNLCFSIRKHIQSKHTWESLMVPSYFRLGGDSQHKATQMGESLLRAGDWEGFLRFAVRTRLTTLISGETGSGKTTLLGVLLSMASRNERIITLEDTRELPKKFKNGVALLTRSRKGPAGNVDMSALLRATLRMRPDRIMLGEIRGSEAYDFITACSTGHGGSMATIHAGSPEMALERLVQLYLLRSGSSYALPFLQELVGESIDVVVQLSRSSGSPAVTSIYYRGKTYGDKRLPYKV